MSGKKAGQREEMPGKTYNHISFKTAETEKLGDI